MNVIEQGSRELYYVTLCQSVFFGTPELRCACRHLSLYFRATPSTQNGESSLLVDFLSSIRSTCCSAHYYVSNSYNLHRIPSWW